MTKLAAMRKRPDETTKTTLRWWSEDGRGGWHLTDTTSQAAGGESVQTTGPMPIEEAIGMLDEENNERGLDWVEGEDRINELLEEGIEQRTREGARAYSMGLKSLDELRVTLTQTDNDRDIAQRLSRERQDERERAQGYRVDKTNLIHKEATVDPNAQLEGGVRVQAGAVVGAAHIGKDTVIAEGAEVRSGVRTGQCVRIAEQTRIETNADIGQGAAINEEATVGNGARIGHHSTVGKGASIGAGAKVKPWTSVPEGAAIEPGSTVTRKSKDRRAGQHRAGVPI